MKKKVTLRLMLISGLFVGLNSALALPLVPSMDAGRGYISQTSAMPISHTYYVIDTANYRDFNSTEEVATYNLFVSTFGTNVDVVPVYACTFSWNCHTYALKSLSSTGCVFHPSQFAPLYNVRSSGNVYRFADHSAVEGNATLPYLSKCGKGPVAYHNSAVYGSHLERWCEKP